VESWSWSWSRGRGKWQAAGATSVVGKAVLTLHPPLWPLSHNVNPRAPGRGPRHWIPKGRPRNRAGPGQDPGRNQPRGKENVLQILYVFERSRMGNATRNTATQPPLAAGQRLTQIRSLELQRELRTAIRKPRFRKPRDLAPQSLVLSSFNFYVCRPRPKGWSIGTSTASERQATSMGEGLAALSCGTECDTSKEGISPFRMVHRSPTDSNRSLQRPAETGWLVDANR
jgi:hypothetical protein